MKGEITKSKKKKNLKSEYWTQLTLELVIYNWRKLWLTKQNFKIIKSWKIILLAQWDWNKCDNNNININCYKLTLTCEVNMDMIQSIHFINELSNLFLIIIRNYNYSVLTPLNSWEN